MPTASVTILFEMRETSDQRPTITFTLGMLAMTEEPQAVVTKQPSCCSTRWCSAQRQAWLKVNRLRYFHAAREIMYGNPRILFECLQSVSLRRYAQLCSMGAIKVRAFA